MPPVPAETVAMVVSEELAETLVNAVWLASAVTVFSRSDIWFPIEANAEFLFWIVACLAWSACIGALALWISALMIELKSNPFKPENVIGFDAICFSCPTPVVSGSRTRNFRQDFEKKRNSGGILGTDTEFQYFRN